jgi:hypothetical protein
MEAAIAVGTLVAIWIVVIWGSIYFNANMK